MCKFKKKVIGITKILHVSTREILCIWINFINQLLLSNYENVDPKQRQ